LILFLYLIIEIIDDKHLYDKHLIKLLIQTCSSTATSIYNFKNKTNKTIRKHYHDFEEQQSSTPTLTPIPVPSKANPKTATTITIRNNTNPEKYKQNEELGMNQNYSFRTITRIPK
jgi:hypothetical protein